jgi:hypothetical protein
MFECLNCIGVGRRGRILPWSHRQSANSSLKSRYRRLLTIVHDTARDIKAYFPVRSRRIRRTTCGRGPRLAESETVRGFLSGVWTDCGFRGPQVHGPVFVSHFPGSRSCFCEGTMMKSIEPSDRSGLDCCFFGDAQKEFSMAAKESLLIAKEINCVQNKIMKERRSDRAAYELTHLTILPLQSHIGLWN